ncbi:MAG: hypothetical protein MK319_06140, partial [Pseudomonadales bacterium]|nr:hypothetical protein [Pseudomonadales bacterium]
QFRSHYKMSAPQSDTENCVAHNGSMIPVPGRDLFVQAWYQGGVSVMDFTDSYNPVEIAYFDRGPIDTEELITGGYWSTYWYNGHIFGTEISRGLDVFRLQVSDFLTENEIAAASLPELNGIVNAQTQKIIVWPDVPVVARAYLDQLQRDNNIPSNSAIELNAALDTAQSLLDGGNGNSRRAANALEDLAENLAEEAGSYSGITRTRYQGLASTLNGIAENIR